MITIVGIVAVVMIILDGWTNKWEICRAIGHLFVNTWKKIANGLK
jgi:FtsZ-interacting cell division protein ZipA